jgi:formylglycine-generating enzyme required for sulfatase activity
VRLLLDFEWEKAASWDERRQVKQRYLWGDEWFSTHANTGDGRGDRLTAAMGCYPAGICACCLHDCTGNVWEWIASTYASYPDVALVFREPGSFTPCGALCASANPRVPYLPQPPAN